MLNLGTEFKTRAKKTVLSKCSKKLNNLVQNTINIQTHCSWWRYPKIHSNILHIRL